MICWPNVPACDHVGTCNRTATPHSYGKPQCSLSISASIARQSIQTNFDTGPTPTGPESTFNYLIDAILAVPDLRSMYLRRLRSIMDEYTNGKLAGVCSLHNSATVKSIVKKQKRLTTF